MAGGDESWGFRGQLISLKDIDPKLKISEVKELLSKYLGSIKDLYIRYAI